MKKTVILNVLTGRPILPYTKDIDNPEGVYLPRKTLEVAKLIALGKTTKEIAFELNRSGKTIEFHRAKIYAKLGIDNVIVLTHWLLFNGLAAPLFKTAEIEVPESIGEPPVIRGHWRDRVLPKNRKYEGLMEEQTATISHKTLGAFLTMTEN
jgi:DNA-binding CsgD family transcriptional regulator